VYKKGETGNRNGRKKGSKNKYRLDVASLFTERNYNPILEMIDDANFLKKEIEENLKKSTQYEIDGDEKKAFDFKRVAFLRLDSKNLINKELSQYFAPKLKAIEFRGNAEDAMQFNINITREKRIGAELNHVQRDENSN